MIKSGREPPGEQCWLAHDSPANFSVSVIKCHLHEVNVGVSPLTTTPTITLLSLMPSSVFTLYTEGRSPQQLELRISRDSAYSRTHGFGRPLSPRSVRDIGSQQSVRLSRPPPIARRTTTSRNVVNSRYPRVNERIWRGSSTGWTNSLRTINERRPTGRSHRRSQWQCCGNWTCPNSRGSGLLPQ